MTAGGRGLALAILLATGVALVAVPVGASEETIVACSNGIAVPDPEENPGLVNDCAVLLDIRDTLAGDATLDWSADKPIRKWVAVTVGLDRVTGLAGFAGEHIWNSQGISVGRVPTLKGRIPPGIGKLSGLRRLSFPGHDLGGEIPPDFGDLAKLELVWLDDNNIGGDIPRSIGNLSSLKFMSLGNNELTGVIPDTIGDLSQLVELGLGGNNLTGNIPKTIGKLRQLRALALHTNKLSGTIPREIGQLSEIRELGFSSNNLSGVIPRDIGKLAHAREVYISNNDLSGSIPISIINLPNIRHLDLSHNELSGEIPKTIGVNIESLVLHNNNLSGRIPNEIGNLSKLRTLILANNLLTSELPSELGALGVVGNGVLNTLYVSGNELTGCIPSTFRDGAGHIHLLFHHDLDSLGLPDCDAELDAAIPEKAPPDTGTGLADANRGAGGVLSVLVAVAAAICFSGGALMLLRRRA